MRAETPLEILQLVERLKADFTSKLNVPDIGTPEDRERNFSVERSQLSPSNIWQIELRTKRWPP